MQPEEGDPALLVGAHVVEVGRRQAWPFINLDNPDTDHEIRLFIDTTFSVHPGWPALEQDDDAVLTALSSLSGLTVTAVERPNHALRLVLGNEYLQIDGEDNRLTTHSPWWIGVP